MKTMGAIKRTNNMQHWLWWCNSQQGILHINQWDRNNSW